MMNMNHTDPLILLLSRAACEETRNSSRGYRRRKSRWSSRDPYRSLALSLAHHLPLSYHYSSEQTIHQMNKPLGLVVLLVVATTLLNVCQAQNSTTCVFQAGAYTSYDSVLQCFYSIPFDPVVKNQTIDALKKAVELYAFLDIANDSPDPNLPMKVNILGGLDAIAKRYAVHRSLARSLRHRLSNLTIAIACLSCAKTLQV